MDLSHYSEPAQAILGAGGQFELTTRQVRGVDYPVFKNAPASLRELYQGALKDTADNTFLVYESSRYTFSDAWLIAERVQAGLHDLGVKPGDRVGIAMRNYPEWVFAYMAITSMGAVVVAMNAWWTGEEMVYGIKDSGLTTLFVDQERFQNISPYLEELSINVVTVRMDHKIGRGVHRWFELTASRTVVPETAIEPDQAAMILYTSGSTAKPKGVVSSHTAIIHSLLGWEASAALARAEAGREPRPASMQPSMILTVPLFHVTGLNGQLLPSFRNGRKCVGMYKWDAEKALAIIEKEKVTHFSGVPTMAYELVNSPNFDKYDISSLRSIGGGGAAMTPRHSKRIKERTSTRASAAYGMTETNGLAASNAGDNLTNRPTSCGRALPPLVNIAIVDEKGNQLPAGETGEITIKGIMNFSEYWGKPDDTAETIVDGWIQTGDIGHIDEEGYVFITDRQKDMIIRGGENIGCQEVEATIYDHPDVTECVVFGVPDDRLGETVAAVVMKRADSLLTVGDVQSYVSDRLARFKVPQYVSIVDQQLPRTASGKLFKRGIKDSFLAGMSAKG